MKQNDCDRGCIFYQYPARCSRGRWRPEKGKNAESIGRLRFCAWVYSEELYDCHRMIGDSMWFSEDGELSKNTFLWYEVLFITSLSGWLSKNACLFFDAILIFKEMMTFWAYLNIYYPLQQPKEYQMSFPQDYCHGHLFLWSCMYLYSASFCNSLLRIVASNATIDNIAHLSELSRPFSHIVRFFSFL